MQEKEEAPLGCAIAMLVGFAVVAIVSIAAITGLVYVVTDALCVAFDESTASVACQSIR